MKNPYHDDPNITAYILGELPEEEATKLRHAASNNAELRSAICEISAETQVLANVLSSNYNQTPALELGEARRLKISNQVSKAKTISQPSNITSHSFSHRKDKKGFVLNIAYVAMGTAAIFCLGIFSLSLIPSTNETHQFSQISEAVQLIEAVPTESFFPVAQSPEIDKPIVSLSSQDTSKKKFTPDIEKHFSEKLQEGHVTEVEKIVTEATELVSLSKAKNGLIESTLSKEKIIDRTVIEALPLTAGKARYNLAARFLKDGQFPPKHVVRYEEFINSYSYNNSPSKDKTEELSVRYRIISCPWKPKTVLVAILMSENHSINNLQASIEMSPETIASYRLLGYETSKSKKSILPQIFDGSNMVIYEVTPKASTFETGYPFIELNTKWTDNQSNVSLRNYSIRCQPVSWKKAEKKFQIATTLAYFAHYLKSGLDDTHLRKIVKRTQENRPYDPSFSSSYQMISMANSIVEFNSNRLAKPRIEPR